MTLSYLKILVTWNLICQQPPPPTFFWVISSISREGETDRGVLWCKRWRTSNVLASWGVGGCRSCFVSIMRDELLQFSHVWASSWADSWLVSSAGCSQSPWFYVECQSLYYTVFFSFFPVLGIWQEQTHCTDSWNEKCIEQGIFTACSVWLRKVSAPGHTWHSLRDFWEIRRA